MGNNSTHEGKPSSTEAGGSNHGSGSSTPRGGSRRGDGPEPQEKLQPTSLVPVEKLAKLLVQKSQKEDGVNGVTEKSFSKYLFPSYLEFASYFYRYMHRAGKCKNKHITQTTFRQQSEKILGMLDDSTIIDTYVRMFSADGEELGTEELRSLAHTSYKICMDHYPEGPQTCMLIHKTLSAVVNGCFNNKDSHSIGFVVRWLQQHCKKLVLPLHRYSIHILSTRHRTLASGDIGDTPWGARDGAEAGGNQQALELATPVLEHERDRVELLCASAAWLLCAAAPPIYTAPHTKLAVGTGGTGSGGSAMAAWLARQVCVLPSHWVPLYNSRDDGLGNNRFLHHTLGYKGATLVVLAFDEYLVVICNAQEWRETHQFTGTADSALIQIYPTLFVMEQAPKMLYLNLSIRGYPHGLRAGTDPRHPLLSVNDGFDNVVYKDAPYPLRTVEVWGCGDQSSRETQLEIKKWQVREAERQRQVKLSAADWMDHPDRYLLELAGRPQYNNSAS